MQKGKNKQQRKKEFKELAAIIKWEGKTLRNINSSANTEEHKGENNQFSEKKFKMNWTNLVEDEPVKSSPHGDDKENVAQISSIKKQKLYHCLGQLERDREI